MSVENPISLTGIEQIERDHGKSFAVGEMAARIDDVYQAERVQGKGVAVISWKHG